MYDLEQNKQFPPYYPILHDFFCYECNFIFQSKYDLDSHNNLVHTFYAPPLNNNTDEPNFLLNQTSSTFSYQYVTYSDTCNYSYNCNPTSSLSLDESGFSINDSYCVPPVEPSAFPQIDGALDELSFINNSYGSSSDVRTANYSLNQQKQIRGIVKDACLNDYEVNVNSNHESCTIKCSAGFYDQAGRPSFSTLERHSVLNFSNFALTVIEVIITNDMNGYEAFRKLKFTVLTHKDDYGSVTVHLYHSTRTIQIQGGTIIDRKKSAVWFTEFTVSRFKELAEKKKYQIKNVNQALLNSNDIRSATIDANQNACQHCNSIFVGNSRP